MGLQQIQDPMSQTNTHTHTHTHPSTPLQTRLRAMLCLFGATCLLLVCWFVSCFRSRGTHEPIDLRETCASSRSRGTTTTTTTNTFTVFVLFWFWFYFWKLQNMCYEKQASEAKQSEAKRSKATQVL